MNVIQGLSDIPSTGLALTMIGTDWCTYCGSTVEAIAAVAPDHPELQISKIDGDEDPDVLTEVGATTYPQLLLHRDGQLVAQRESAKEDVLRTWLAENGVS